MKEVPILLSPVSSAPAFLTAEGIGAPGRPEPNKKMSGYRETMRHAVAQSCRPSASPFPFPFLHMACRSACNSSVARSKRNFPRHRRIPRTLPRPLATPPLPNFRSVLVSCIERPQNSDRARLFMPLSRFQCRTAGYHSAAPSFTPDPLRRSWSKMSPRISA
jgi:hypothetical protein